MPDDPQPGLTDLQAEVLRLLGHCVIRLQRYETGLKALLRASDIKIEQRAGSEAQLKHGIETEKDTLGALVAKFLDSYLVPEPSEPPQPREVGGDDGQLRIRSRWQVVTTAQRHQEVHDELKGFVALRNRLVHHFVEDKDLNDPGDCRRALLELTDALEAIEQQIRKLSSQAKVHSDSSKMIIDHLSKEWVQDLMLGRPILWETTEIVAGLRQAEEELGANGWTQLADAKQWMAANRPDQTPQQYRCVSWQQVLHESKLFELTYLKQEQQRLRCYRSKRSPSLD